MQENDNTGEPLVYTISGEELPAGVLDAILDGLRNPPSSGWTAHVHEDGRFHISTPLGNFVLGDSLPSRRMSDVLCILTDEYNRRLELYNVGLRLHDEQADFIRAGVDLDMQAYEARYAKLEGMAALLDELSMVRLQLVSVASLVESNVLEPHNFSAAVDNTGAQRFVEEILHSVYVPYTDAEGDDDLRFVITDDDEGRSTADILRGVIRPDDNSSGDLEAMRGFTSAEEH